MARIVRIEVPSDNAERASKFYETVFGWKFGRLEGAQSYWFCNEGPGSDISAGITKRIHPDQRLITTIEVDDLDKTIESIVAAGGTVVAPKMALPGVGFLAFCTDSEGNTFGLAQQDRLAK